MTEHTPDLTDPAGPPAEGDEEPEFHGDYSQLGFRDLQKLCKARGLLADGKAPELIKKLREHDRVTGSAVDLTVPDVEPDGDDGPEIDLLALGDVVPAGAPDGGEVASAPSSGPSPGLEPGPVERSQVVAFGPTGPALVPPDQGRSVTPAPIVPETAGRRHEERNLTTRGGPVENPNREITAYRVEHAVGPRDLIDADHFDLIARTHALAEEAGYRTRGAPTIGTRVGYATGSDGGRTAIYEVSVRRRP